MEDHLPMDVLCFTSQQQSLLLQCILQKIDREWDCSILTLLNSYGMQFYQQFQKLFSYALKRQFNQYHMIMKKMKEKGKFYQKILNTISRSLEKHIDKAHEFNMNKNSFEKLRVQVNQRIKNLIVQFLKGQVNISEILVASKQKHSFTDQIEVVKLQYQNIKKRYQEIQYIIKNRKEPRNRKCEENNYEQNQKYEENKYNSQSNNSSHPQQIPLTSVIQKTSQNLEITSTPLKQKRAFKITQEPHIVNIVNTKVETLQNSNISPGSSLNNKIQEQKLNSTDSKKQDTPPILQKNSQINQTNLLYISNGRNANQNPVGIINSSNTKIFGSNFCVKPHSVNQLINSNLQGINSYQKNHVGTNVQQIPSNSQILSSSKTGLKYGYNVKQFNG